MESMLCHSNQITLCELVANFCSNFILLSAIFFQFSMIFSQFFKYFDSRQSVVWLKYQAAIASTEQKSKTIWHFCWLRASKLYINSDLQWEWSKRNDKQTLFSAFFRWRRHISAHEQTSMNLIYAFRWPETSIQITFDWNKRKFKHKIKFIRIDKNRRQNKSKTLIIFIDFKFYCCLFAFE